MKTQDLIGPALDWAVAEARGKAAEWMHDRKIGYVNSASTDWAQGGPIIERERIDLGTDMGRYPELEDGTHGKDLVFTWVACCDDGGSGVGPTPLIAAMRCYVASKLGNEVEVPKELL